MNNRSSRSNDAFLKQLPAFGRLSDSKSPWPGHKDLAAKDKTFAYLSAAGEPFTLSRQTSIHKLRRARAALPRGCRGTAQSRPKYRRQPSGRSKRRHGARYRVRCGPVFRLAFRARSFG